MKDLSKVIFITDMDGTLLPSNKLVNPKDIEAISAFRSCGGRFTVATGRAVQSASQYFDVLRLDEPMIVLNGGGIYDCKESHFTWQKFVDTSAYNVVKDIIKKFPSIGGEIDFSDIISIIQDSYKEQYHIDISYKNDVKVNRESIDDVSENGWCKVLFAAEPNEINNLEAYINEKKYEKLTFVRSSSYFYEILPNDCSKGYALKKMLELYNKSDCTLVACGDFYNDIEMLEYADISLAPSNAIDAVKNIVSKVTEADCNNGAVAEALDYVMNVL